MLKHLDNSQPEELMEPVKGEICVCMCAVVCMCLCVCSRSVYCFFVVSQVVLHLSRLLPGN